MSGLLALLDDVAAIARLAAAQADDVAGQAAKVGAKTAGILVDDAAVTPKYVTGLPAARELPIVWKIARASAFNKIVILLPVAMLLDTFLPWALTPLLMLGGAYLCFEGAEKVWHVLAPHEGHGDGGGAQKAEVLDAARLEERRVRGAIKTDFILSAEITTIALSAIEAEGVWARGAVLAVVAIAITAVVYGAVALLVKADDVGLKLNAAGRLAATRALGRAIVRSMPTVLKVIGTVGTAAMLWVGGNIVVHGLEVLGWPWPYETIHHLAEEAALATGGGGAVAWAVTAALDGVLGVLLGLALIPVVKLVLAPIAQAFGSKGGAEEPHA